jgi:NADH dehydrogenase
MKIAITGGTGFIGKHLARDLVQQGHQVILIARGLYSRNTISRSLENATFVALNTRDTEGLKKAFAGCKAVVHCAGTSVEDNSQTFHQVHVEGTRSAVSAAQQAGVKKFVLASFLNVRPGTRSVYYSSKWKGEEIVRQSDLNYTILKAGLIYGQGDHLIHNLANLFRKLPVFATVGVREQTIRPVAIEDLVRIINTVLLDEGLLSRQTVAVIGPEEFPFSTAARRIAKAMGKPFLLVLPFPVVFQRLLAWFSERFMPKPLVAAAQVQMLADGISNPLPDSQPLPDALKPSVLFTEEQIRKGLPKNYRVPHN